MAELKTVPYAFQLQDIRRLHRWEGRGLLGWEQGLGKTLGALLYAIRHPDVFPMVVVAPLSVKYNWLNEAVTHIDVEGMALEKTRPPERGLPDYPIYTVNYDILYGRRDSRAGPGWLEALKAIRPRLIVVDECQKLQNPSSRQSEAVRELCKGVPYVIALSGTPITNRPIEFWTVLNILRPQQFPNRYAFAHRYCNPKRTYWGWDFTGASNLDELHGILTNPDNGVMLRRRKVDVLKDLPAKTRTVIPVPISKPREYQTAVKDFKGWLKTNHPGKMTTAFRAKAFTQLGYLQRLAAQLKLPAVFSWIDDYLESDDAKLIVFGIHKSVLGPVYERYKKQSVLIDGSVTGKKRQAAVDQFNGSNRTRLCIANMIAGGTGWSARKCSTTAFIEVDTRPGVHAQCEDRTHGISRGREGYVSQSIYLLARDTVEEKICKSIHRKQKILNAVLDNEQGDDFNLLDQLLHEYLL